MKAGGITLFSKSSGDIEDISSDYLSRGKQLQSRTWKFRKRLIIFLSLKGVEYNTPLRDKTGIMIHP